MNTDYPLVSIIIPCYNASYYLKEVLESIKLQSYPNIECIAINDGSTDNTLDILNTFSDSQFHIYNQENRGLSDTRNLGMEKLQVISFSFATVTIFFQLTLLSL